MLGEKALELPLHEVERDQLQRMQEIMRLMLQAHIEARGKGDVGMVSKVVKGEEETELHSHKWVQVCHEQIVFGKVSIDRIRYRGRGNRPQMKYNEYLKQGLPIGSGSVKGACKNLIKDRMERNGMKWTKDMAESMLKMRALYLSGDFEDYWSFRIQKEQERLYPKGRWETVDNVVQK